MKKILFILIWLLFLYFCYLLSLAYGFYAGIVAFLIIVGGHVLSVLLHQLFYKKYLSHYRSLMYPTLFIGIVGIFVFAFHMNTGIYTFKNEGKTIIFHGMNHIGTEKYYNNVRESIKKYKTEGYILVYEGIQVDESDGESDMDSKLLNIFQGNDFLTNKYFIPENSVIFLGLVNNKDYLVDLDGSEIEIAYEEYRKKYQIKHVVTEKKEPFFSHEIQNYKQKYITPVDASIIAAYYNMVFLLSEIINRDISKDTVLDNILVNYRNENLLEEVFLLNYDKVVIMYGEGHVDGFYELLKQSDENWELIYVEKLYPYKL